MLSIQNTSETTLQYIDTQNVSTENDVCHYLRTQLLILINNANTRTVVGSFIEMWMRIDTDLFVHPSEDGRIKIMVCCERLLKVLSVVVHKLWPR